MSWRPVIGAVLLGLGVLVIGLAGRADTTPGIARWRRRLPGPGVVRSYRRVGAALVTAFIVLAVTGWPVLALMAASAVALLPTLIGARHAEAKRIARLEAIAAWTRRLADVLVAGMGIEQGLTSSARVAPAAIAPQVSNLAAQLRSRRPLDECLRAFADALDDPTGDLVAAALLLASRRRGQGLAQILTSLASTVDAQVAMRRAVEADRAQPRATMRYVAWITLAVIAALFLFDRRYVAPFGTPAGEAVLAMIGLVFAAAFFWMHSLASATPLHRFLSEQQGKASVPL
jgi:Flp pilus assembly protein TadB